MAKEKPSIEKVIDHVLSYLAVLEKEKLPIERVFLFGSHAKKKARQWSDIDVCIISPKFRNRCHAIDYLWKKRRDEDVEHDIEPVGFHPKDFIDEDPLAWEIKTTELRFGRITIASPWRDFMPNSRRRKNFPQPATKATPVGVFHKKK